MKSNLLNINKIFTDRIFRIPDYQRGYAWSERQLKDFWNDLTQLEDGKNHYVGVLTLEDVHQDIYENWIDDLWIIESKSFSPYYVVDGQQRLTTAIILIQAIIEINTKDKKINYITNKDIRKRFIFDSKGDESISGSYIFGYEKDNPSYEYLKKNIFLDASDDHLPDQDTIYTHKLEFAKKFFKDQLTKLDFNQIEKLLKKITQHFLFNIYSMSEDIDVYITFETMNNRGKPLSILELLKNRLIFLSTKLETDQHEKNKLRRSINEAWKTIYHNLGRNKLNPLDDDIFLLNHFFYYFGQDVFNEDENTSLRFRHRNLRAIYKDYLLENLFTIKNISSYVEASEEKIFSRSVDTSLIYDYVKSLKSSVETWFEILNPESSDFSKEEKDVLSRIYRLDPHPENEKFLILALVFFEKTKVKRERESLLLLIEKILFIRTLGDYQWNYIWNDDFYLEQSIDLASGKITTNGVLNEIEDMKNKFIHTKYYKLEIIKRFKSSGFYHWSAIRYFLYEYESYLKSQSKTKRAKLNWESLILGEDGDDFISIEHIYPQQPRLSCWTSKFKIYNAKERKAIKNSLGNLLPLSKPKNSSLGNKCFESKKSRENDTVGYVYGCYSENEVAQNEEWTAKEILYRGIKMVEFFESRWGIHFANNEEVLDFLGIPFVQKKEGIPLTKKKRLTSI